jgi:hypothetical protein
MSCFPSGDGSSSAFDRFQGLLRQHLLPEPRREHAVDAAVFEIETLEV